MSLNRGILWQYFRLNVYHGDSSAAIVVDGKLIAAVEEERFRRIKHCISITFDRVLLEGSWTL